MYEYNLEVKHGMYIHTAYPTKGTQHKKVFNSPINKEDQNTLNIYLKGKYKVTYGDGAVQEFNSIQTNLDSNLLIIPSGLCIEEPLTEINQRICISPVIKTKKIKVHKGKSKLEKEGVVTFYSDSDWIQVYLE